MEAMRTQGMPTPAGREHVCAQHNTSSYYSQATATVVPSTAVALLDDDGLLRGIAARVPTIARLHHTLLGITTGISTGVSWRWVALLRVTLLRVTLLHLRRPAEGQGSRREYDDCQKSQ